MATEFWGPKQDNFYLSNFYLAEIVDLENNVWPTSEHLYQARKFVRKYNPSYQAEELIRAIRMAATPRKAKELAHKNYSLIENTTLQRKVQLMRPAIRLKFDQHPKLRHALLYATQPLIMEVSTIDGYWGRGKDGRGVDLMGMLLMELRAIYTEELSQSPEGIKS